MAWAWGEQGHHIIARIAQAQLSESARLQIERLLALEPGATLESLSTWADEHRSPATSRWHYVNFPRDSCSYDAIRDCPDGQCIVAAIDAQSAFLASDAPDAKRLLALKYLVHLVGDLHQPLHAGYRDDKGGNKYQLQAFMRSSNLHALWDSGLIKSMEQDAETIARSLQGVVTEGELKNSSVAQVAEESCNVLALPGFYPQRKVGEEYVQRFEPLLKGRLALAGARLAAWLNKTLR